MPHRLAQGSAAGAVVLTPEVLRGWPLPAPDAGGDKDARGCVLIVGGSPEMPGAVILAAVAALRAGAGKLQIATCRSVAQIVAATVPESRVFALPETAVGGIDPASADMLIAQASRAAAMLIGPGMIDEEGTSELLRRVAPAITCATLVLDAVALTCGAEAADTLHRYPGEAVLTPHAGEMASMLGIDKEAVTNDPALTARHAAAETRAVVALKGAETYIAAPGGELYCNRSGNVGLATSGSGDTLAGIIAGLAARGAGALQSAAWGVSLHGRAGDRLAERMGGIGFLARELLDEVPKLMAELGRGNVSRR